MISCRIKTYSLFVWRSAVLTSMTFFLIPYASFAALSTPYVSISPYTFYPSEEIFYIEGTADPNTIITILLQQTGEEPLRLSTNTEKNGTWVLSRRIPLQKGFWEMRVRAEQGTDVSSWTEQRIIRVVATGIPLGNTSLPFSVITVAFFFLFATGLMFLIYTFLKAKSAHRKELIRRQRDHIHALELRLQRKEVEDAIKTVRSTFSQIKEDPLSVQKIDQLENTIEEELRTIKDNAPEL
ncbi:MAG: hypothetical protein COU90_03600 [Candidatus Ryanbacteria bacterium CG10_big_fil_rev_8_21_14_0_10_43_42]|uniref:Bacterial Ig-like domain-containing protein n=1 Tax=Candidatus Ryanbacteria bacterium CG10_big_fil_rev_8_21_14_0_10_43_42 TaxID=1974864 RepID=A0A2M8KWF8_9BACT|nr:MAG: hypothetical protein COU90_03600 [Candidatus Ryanbacteria bacterium CG10_big_fil_rev_8_21_14_0_10_43_42]